MTDFTITHPGGTRAVTAAQVRPRQTAFSLRAVGVTPAGDAKVRGDGRMNPAPVDVALMFWDQGTLEANADLAYTVLAEAEAATSITWHEGTLAVDGLLSYRLRGDGQAAVLRLMFAPKALESWAADSAELVTYAGETVTYNGFAVTYGQNT